MSLKNNEGLPYFNWEMYENWNGGFNLKENKRVKSTDPKCKVFCHEAYAEDLYRLYDATTVFACKDLTVGQYLRITNITCLGDDIASVELFGGININVDLTREKRFLQLLGFESIKDFRFCIASNKEEFLSLDIKAYVTEGGNNPRISLLQGYALNIKEEMMEQLKNPTKAYVAKIKTANRGGYFVDICGVAAFMPGSLAAPNKIIDFQSMVGKEVIVMVEDFITAENSFIVSHKKYIEHVLPIKLRELDTDIKYSGTVTGTSKYGIFLEFGEMYTGLLHVTKMKDDTKQKYQSRQFKPGTTFEFYIDEISKDNRIILSEESPAEKKERQRKFIEEIKDKEISVKVINIIHSGILVSYEENIGMIPTKELKKNRLSAKNLLKGDTLSVIFDRLDEDKLLFKLPTQKSEEKQ